MLSRNEIWEAQRCNYDRCKLCSHKPIDEFCREQMVFGEQRMDFCSHWRPRLVDLGNATGAVEVYEPWFKEGEKRSKRMLRPEK